ncbi:MAG: hypothetical protein LUQ07_08040 [Methanospirillum sp.]|nr:hypothetical protein [Methanospirillum sp.]
MAGAEEVTAGENSGIVLLDHAGSFQEKNARFSSEMDTPDCQNVTLPETKGIIRIYDYKKPVLDQSYVNPLLNDNNLCFIPGTGALTLVGRSFEDLESGGFYYYELAYDPAKSGNKTQADICWNPIGSTIKNKQLAYEYSMVIVFYPDATTPLPVENTQNAPVIGYSGSGTPYYDDLRGSQSENCPEGYACAPALQPDPNSMGILFEEPKTDWDVNPFTWAPKLSGL